MDNGLKLAIYLTLAVIASVSGFFAFGRFKTMMSHDRFKGADVEKSEEQKSAPSKAAATNELAASTNGAPGSTNLVSTNLVADTNLTSTNISAVSTNAPTNAVAESSPAKKTKASSKKGAKEQVESGEDENAVPTALSSHGAAASGKKSHLGVWLALFVLSVIGIGILLALDVSQYFANKAYKAVYNEEGEGVAKPEYEAAEQLWANGKHLEAIGLMREYLNKNPREQFVALRIAEIYEKDLGNFLAAALEYEEILKNKLPDERWGWAAVHLCNLYFKLGQEQKAFKLLRRLADEYPDTAAAEKARRRLEQVDAMESIEISTQPEVEAKAAPAKKAAAAEPASNLPPGFRPKK